uniref:DUF4173 domain-containing protein n=1 Tax=Roseihalotalea indica TaxID=2867963 RepID=A0AA49GT14_9BACT|nr:DUF4173 domain-containing protein [Tunicatimonas sp. TK19036]
MRKRKIKIGLWAGASLMSSFLFYQQAAGINFLVFNLLVVSIAVGLYPALRQSRQGKLMVVGCLLTAVGVVWHHTWLAILLNWVSFVALAGFCVFPRTSLAVALPNGLYAALISFWKGKWWSVQPEHETRTGLSMARVLSWIIPVMVTSLFLLLYISANPAFAALVQQTGGEIISPGRLIFTLGIAYGLLAFFYPSGMSGLIEADQRISDTLTRQRVLYKRERSISMIGLKYEYRTGWLLFALLNGLLFLFNGIDLYYLTSGRLPESVTYSEYVHQGVTALIISIVLAIGIVMYFFRGNLNFYHRNAQLRMAAYGWIVQNGLLVLTTAYKNSLYIDAYGLTQKRVGVYVYLLLALAGLASTYVKVGQIKSTMFLVRCNLWVWYLVLGGMTLINWPRLITQYNLAHFPAQHIDFYYLSRLSDNNLDLLATAIQQPKYQLARGNKSYIVNKISQFKKTKRQQDWRSWNYAEAQVLNRLAHE